MPKPEVGGHTLGFVSVHVVGLGVCRKGDEGGYQQDVFFHRVLFIS
jgi:hypothetical protein